MKAAFAQNSTKKLCVCVQKYMTARESPCCLACLLTPAHTQIHTHTHTQIHTHTQTHKHLFTSLYTCTGKEINSGLIDSLHADVVKRNVSG